MQVVKEKSSGETFAMKIMRKADILKNPDVSDGLHIYNPYNNVSLAQPMPSMLTCSLRTTHLCAFFTSLHIHIQFVSYN